MSGLAILEWTTSFWTELTQEGAEFASGHLADAAPVIGGLKATGWTFSERAHNADGEYLDVRCYWRRICESEDEAYSLARAAGASIDHNWAIGWLDGGTLDTEYPDAEWGEP